MANGDSKIDRPGDSLSGETCGSMVVVISQIRDQKERRSDYRRHLAIAMRLHAQPPDVRVPSD